MSRLAGLTGLLDLSDLSLHALPNRHYQAQVWYVVPASPGAGFDGVP
jgi:hypothetical protein